jgi:hypothetical protein
VMGSDTPSPLLAHPLLPQRTAHLRLLLCLLLHVTCSAVHVDLSGQLLMYLLDSMYCCVDE